MTKIEIRKNALVQRNNLSRNQIAAWSLEIYNKVVNSQDFQNAKIIHIYKSFGSEVETENIIQNAFDANKIVVISKVEGNQTLSHWQILPNSTFTQDKYGVKNPESNYTTFDIRTLEISDLIVIPIVAFDSRNNRIGYGKGFYDKFLDQVDSKKIGIAFKCQLVEDFEPDIWDVKLDLIVQNL